MRLDKLISACGVASRSETARACRAGLVTVNGQTARSADMQVNPETDAVSYGGRAVAYRRFVYLMLNKPAGYVSSTDAGDGPPVTDLLPEEYRRMGVFPCGRLDRDTLGLMLLTNNGPLSHRLLAPRSHVAKSYRFAVSGPLGRREAAMLEAGVDIGGYVLFPHKGLLHSRINRCLYAEGLTYIQGVDYVFLENLVPGNYGYAEKIDGSIMAA